MMYESNLSTCLIEILSEILSNGYPKLTQSPSERFSTGYSPIRNQSNVLCES